jgi:hypothetical protein
VTKLKTIETPRKGTTTDLRWEKALDDPELFNDAHTVFTSWADIVRERPASVERRKRNLLYASMYSNLPMLGFGVNQYTRSMQSQGIISLNVTQNAIDSLVAKVCKNDTRPMFTTVEGDYELREAMENADKYVDGHFFNNGYYTDTHPGAVLDCSIYGLGIVKNHEVDGEAVNERTFCHEMILDDRECMYGNPTRPAQRKYYGKQETFDRFRKPDSADGAKEWNEDLERAVDSGGAENDPDYGDFDRDEQSDQILVYEGYVLPRAGGRGAIIQCIRGKTLKLREWKAKESPFNFLRPMVQMSGLYGIGCAEKIIGIQREINRLIRDIQMAMHLIAKPHWMVEASSNVLASSLNNDMATIIKYSGAVPPTVYTPQAMSEQVFSHLQFLYKTAYEIIGVSQLSAQSQKPAGIDSAVGLRTYQNIETERFGQFVKASEAFAAANAKKTARVVSGLKKPPTMVTPARGKQTIELVTWKDVDLDSIAVQVYPASKMPDTPAGKREYALELAQYGVAKPDDIFEMLEWSDTEAWARRRLAGRKNVEKDILRLRRGEKVVRDAIGDHAAALQMMSDAYEEAKHDGLPTERLAQMRKYVTACARFLAKKPPVAPAPIGPAGDQPPDPMGGPPMGPPPGGQPIPGAPGEGPPPLPNAPTAPAEAA